VGVGNQIAWHSSSLARASVQALLGQLWERQANLGGFFGADPFEPTHKIWSCGAPGGDLA
jgi:hypothetical protein